VRRATRATLLGQGILVADLRGRQKPQRLDALVADQGLRELGDALDVQLAALFAKPIDPPPALRGGAT
jgi:hypothetical protein